MTFTTDNFAYRNGTLTAEAVPLPTLADTFGTPLYVYSRRALLNNWLRYREALPASDGMLCYSVKANSNLTVLTLLAEQGAGFDIVSVGELERVLRAGGRAERIVFSGVGKQPEEMARALEIGIHCFNVESEAELHQLERVAQAMNRVAPVSLRVNPDVDAGTHPYISTGLRNSKFGIPMEAAAALYRVAAASEHLQPIGIDCHIGSQLTDTAPLIEALDSVLVLVDQLHKDGIVLQHVDMGGGLGVRYEADDRVPDVAAYIDRLLGQLRPRALQLVLEPGRSVVADAGLFLTRVNLLKSQGAHHFAVVDGAMNDLLRPALYGAWQAVLPVAETAPEGLPSRTWDIVGPVCESGDFLARERKLALREQDLLAVMQAGAYGAVMASNYNTRPRPAEVLVDGDRVQVIRRREVLTDLWALEEGSST